MTKKEKLYSKIKNAPENVRFEEICALAEMFGFILKALQGSHKTYRRAGVIELLNFQNCGGKAKPYQVRQLLKIIEFYDLEVK